MEQITDFALSDFGALLRRLRRGAGLTQEALAERSGLGVRTIQDLERGVHNPLNQTLQQLVRALALTGERRSELEAAARPTPRQPHLITLPRRFPSATADGSAARTPRHNLPAPLTSFVGRERDLADLHGLFGSTRLLTLTGAGGVGKTRLAVRLGHGLLESYPDGVWLIDLAPVADPALVPQAVTSAMGVHEQPGLPLAEVLRHYLATKQALLVLDNCEHLLDACAHLVQVLLEGCPELRILTTSREPLRCAGEVAWRVPSLCAPDPGRLPPEGEDLRAVVAQAEATRLFVERATAARPGFGLTAANARGVVEICWRLDGIPLALELAAARVTVLAVDQIARRLDDRLGLLTGGSRAALPRQRTLLATIDWSFDLLTAPERALFRRLAVFVGGWTLEAAEAVCSGVLRACPE